MTTFTNGPWFTDSRYVRTCVFSVAAEDSPEKHIATVILSKSNYYELTREEHKANARLIAAAPDLYAVLERLEESAAYWSEYDVPLGIVDDIKAALAKARGEQ